MSKFAEGTTVTPERSMAEIVQTLRRYGADGFQTNLDDRAGVHSIVFRVPAKDGTGYRFVRLTVRIPERRTFIEKALREMRQKPPRKTREQLAAEQWEAEVRRRWRALALFVKAALEAVESEITTLEQVFLAHLLVGDGTVGEVVLPQVARMYEGKGAQLQLGSGEVK